MKVYIHKETNKINSIINLDDNIYADEDTWEDNIKEIEENYDKSFEFDFKIIFRLR